MDIGFQRVSAIVIVVGALVFLSAAALPVSYRVFPEPAPARKLAYIEAAPTAWTVAQVLFGLGATLTFVGIALLAREVDAWPMQASVAFLLAGLLPWIWHLYARAADPATFAAGSLPMWPLAAYFLLTEVGLAVYGIALLSSGLPPWVGWVVIGTMALVFALTLITRDMVPAVYYLVTLLTGVMLYR
jgi:hypothetical protein